MYKPHNSCGSIKSAQHVSRDGRVEIHEVQLGLVGLAMSLELLQGELHAALQAAVASRTPFADPVPGCAVQCAGQPGGAG